MLHFRNRSKDLQPLPETKGVFLQGRTVKNTLFHYKEVQYIRYRVVSTFAEEKNRKPPFRF